MERILRRVAVERRFGPLCATRCRSDALKGVPYRTRAWCWGRSLDRPRQWSRQPPCFCTVAQRVGRRLVERRFNISSNVFHGSATGFLSLPATSSSTSGVARVWCSGRIDRPARVRHRRRRARLGQAVGPRFEERMVGQDQIRQHARLVEEAAEAGDERNLLAALRARLHAVGVANTGLRRRSTAPAASVRRGCRPQRRELRQRSLSAEQPAAESCSAA